VKLMRRIGRNVDRCARLRHTLRSPKRDLQFSLEYGESLFEVVTVRRRPASGRHMHIN
jgi:hypothetical protein